MSHSFSPGLLLSQPGIDCPLLLELTLCMASSKPFILCSLTPAQIPFFIFISCPSPRLAILLQVAPWTIGILKIFIWFSEAEQSCGAPKAVSTMESCLVGRLWVTGSQAEKPRFQGLWDKQLESFKIIKMEPQLGCTSVNPLHVHPERVLSSGLSVLGSPGARCRLDKSRC